MRSRREARLLLVALTLALVAVSAHASSRQEVIPKHIHYALKLAAVTYGVPYRDLREVSWCESRWNPRADGYSGAGLFQFTLRTWQTTPYRAFSPLDPVAASLAAAWLVTEDGGWRQWTCRP